MKHNKSKETVNIMDNIGVKDPNKTHYEGNRDNHPGRYE